MKLMSSFWRNVVKKVIVVIIEAILGKPKK